MGCFLLEGWWRVRPKQTNKLNPPPAFFGLPATQKGQWMSLWHWHFTPYWDISCTTLMQRLFWDYSSIFNIIRPLKLAAKLADLRVAVTTLNFLTEDRRMEKKVCWAPSEQQTRVTTQSFLNSFYSLRMTAPLIRTITSSKQMKKTTMAYLRGGTSHVVHKVTVDGEDWSCSKLWRTFSVLVQDKLFCDNLISITLANRLQFKCSKYSAFTIIYCTNLLDKIWILLTCIVRDINTVYILITNYNNYAILNKAS